MRRGLLVGAAFGMFGMTGFACGGSDGATDEPQGDASDAGDEAAFDASAHDGGDTSLDASRDAADAPIDSAEADAGYPYPTKIKYVVVLVKENHTFDNMFTGFPGTDPPPASVKMADGTTVARKAAPFKALEFGDTTHAHDAGVTEYNDGKMNGWSGPLSAAATEQALSYFPEAQIPSYWAYARNFVLFDRFFSTHMGPSSPGHISVHTATTVNYENPTGDGDCHDATLTGSVGTIDPVTGARKDMFPCFDVPAVEELLPASLTWRAYPGSPLDKVKSIGGDAKLRTAHYRPMAALLTDLDKGELANLTIANIS